MTLQDKQYIVIEMARHLLRPPAYALVSQIAYCEWENKLLERLKQAVKDLEEIET